METNNPNTYRYERKFRVSELTKYEIEALIKIHPAMFSETYPPRFVNNLYLDSINKENFFDAVDGIKRRLKVRIRWYGELFGSIEKATLEIKTKEGYVGKKEQYPLIPFFIGADLNVDEFTGVFMGSQIPEVLRSELISSDPTLLNRYRRKYFQSADRKFRITIDTDLQFYRVKRHNNYFVQKITDIVGTVIELKYDRLVDIDAAHIANYFPFRMTKSSKYVSGVERLFF